MGMDRAIEKKTWSLKRIFTYAAIALAVVAMGWVATSIDGKRSFRVDRDRVTLASVEQGVFRDVIPVRATVEPLRTVYIDAVQGGTIEEIYVEEGAMVKAGQPLLKFINTAFQLNVFSQEARISEQLDINSNTRLSLDQNRLNLKRQLNDIEYAITRLERRIRRLAKLRENELVSEDDMDSLKDELDYQVKQRAITLENIEREEAIRSTKIKQLKESEERLTEHLKVVRRSLADLEVRAPISGLLSSLDAEVGESKVGGSRLGKVDKVDSYKLTAKIDEFYISRVEVGQQANFNLAGNRYLASVDKVYPEVRAGRFEIDLFFSGKSPQAIRRGLTIQTQLQLGADKPSLLIRNGGFYQDSGGNWVFVLEDDGIARRRDVTLGRSNSENIEVLSGLSQGERVIVSSYASYREIEEIILNN